MFKFLKENVIFIASSILIVGLVVGVRNLATVGKQSDQATGNQVSVLDETKDSQPKVVSTQPSTTSAPTAITKQGTPKPVLLPKVSTIPARRDLENEEEDD